MVKMTSWGNCIQSENTLIRLPNRLDVQKLINRGTHSGLAYGMGRSYGDVCLNDDILWGTRGLDRFVSFDENSGRLTCEAGMLLKDIQTFAVSRGWMLPITPGTQLITLGGAIANDVHGKNHHVHGSFGDHINKIVLSRTTGEVVECGPDFRQDWFSATVGGIGLTGVILEAEIQLRKIKGPWLSSESIPYSSLGEFFNLADSSEADWEYTVSWIDCTSANGQGIFMRANHSDRTDKTLPPRKSVGIPMTPPISMVNKFTLPILNAGYYALGRLKSGTRIEHYESFFYPLDNIKKWNRIYGPRGFYQYQCLVPMHDGRQAISDILKEIARSGNGSFLAVLKTFGNRQSVGMLGFARPGITLALDFPNNGDQTKKLFERLDEIVGEVGGCIYLAKDACMPKKLFEKSYPQLERFLVYRDPGISSLMSKRLMGF